MAKQKPSVAAVAKPAEATAQPNGAAAEAPKERVIITDFTLKLQHHKDVPSVPEVLGQIESWAKSKGFLIDKKETSTPGYASWAIHTPASLAATQAKANNVMREVRSLRDDELVKAEATKLGITPDELLKRALAKVKQELGAK